MMLAVNVRATRDVAGRCTTCGGIVRERWHFVRIRLPEPPPERRRAGPAELPLCGDEGSRDPSVPACRRYARCPRGHPAPVLGLRHVGGPRPTDADAGQPLHSWRVASPRRSRHARDFVFVEDACEAFVRAAELQVLGAGEVFNIASGTQTTLRELTRGGARCTRRHRRASLGDDAGATVGHVHLGWRPDRGLATPRMERDHRARRRLAADGRLAARPSASSRRGTADERPRSP